MKFNEYIEMLLESTVNESRRIDRELEKGEIEYDGNKITGVERKRSDDKDWRGVKSYKGTRKTFGDFSFELEKSSNRTFKEYVDGLKRLLKNVKEIKSLITGNESDKDLQKIWSIIDDINHSDYSFKDFVRHFSTSITTSLGSEGWAADVNELVIDFLTDADMSFADFRKSLSLIGFTPEDIKEFMNSNSYKKLISIRNFSNKMDNLQSIVNAADKYTATRKNIEKLSNDIKTLESNATFLMSQISK